MRNLKKVIALVAVFAMLVSTVAFAQVFSDVASTDNYAEAIETLSTLGIITGDDENNDGVMEFRPNDTITRAEVTAIVSRIQGMNNAAQTNTSFADVPSTHWASGYVAQAANQGIVNGYGDGNFGPEDNVKYQEMVKMLMETLGYRPFADDNGGYPTGYLTAAQRYGVLDDVVGGGIDVEASRGMVAQMVYNAVDTPLMDMVTYGSNGEYTVYENRDGYGFKTLLTRDLKMVKVSGKVVANSYTDTTTNTTDIDASASKTIKVKLDNSTNNYNYLGSYLYANSSNSNTTDTRAMKFYQGEEDVDSLIGYAVDLYAKQDSNRNDDYTIVAITPNASKNNSIEFTLDQYEGYTEDTNSGKGTLSYLKNETDRNETKLTVQANPTVIYNGVAAVGAMSLYFGDTEGAKTSIIEPNTNYSGKVTLLDTDDASGYDVVVIEVGVSAVVKEVTSRGQVKFMKRVTVPGVLSNEASKETLASVDFDEDDSNRITNLTKDGVAYDYTKLQKWDVVTIVWNAYDDVYNMRVLGEDNYVDGTITSVPASSNSTQKYTLSDGNKYELAADAYTTTNLEAGVSGRFYIDEYGKLVAHDKDVEVEGAGEPVSGNYAYVLNTSVTAGTWGNTNDITLQILDKSGEIYEANLASTVKFVNLPVEHNELFTALDGTAGNDSVTVKLENYATQADSIASALKNQIITYAGNSSGEIKTVVLPGAKNDDNADLAYIATAADGKNVSYDEDTMIFKGAGVTINADTYVFYITNEAGKVAYGSDTLVATADKDRCSVVNGAALVEEYYDIVAVDPDSNDEAGAVVILNKDGAISASSSVAVIDSVGKAMANGVDEVYVVDFYMNGELQSATTKVDMTGEDDIALAKRGDIFKLNVSGDTVTYAKKVLAFTDRGTDEKAYAKSATTILNPTIANAGNDEDYYFGAITKIGNNGNATLAIVESGKITGKNLETIKEGSANVYVYDPELRDAKALSVGGLGDAEVDEDLNTVGGTVTGGDLRASTVDTPAYGMMDYAFARYYNNKPADIVVYKNYDFGSYKFTAAN